MTRLSYLKRAVLTRHLLGQKIFKLLEDKQTNLCVALDVTRQSELLRLADLVGPHVAIVKTHVDILEDFTPDFGPKLRKLADKHHFFLFEDRKFADIGHTSSLQYGGGIYRIADWADLINAHILPGPGIIEGLKQVGGARGRGLLLLAEMSSEGSLATNAYAKKAVALARAHPDFALGFICQRKLSSAPHLLHFTPGVKIGRGKDSLGQQYRTPEEAIGSAGCDIAIVGRDIYADFNPEEAALRYRRAAWEAYAKTQR
jgi:orotidine 5'-phosphate decarboxylase subfamily 1